MATKRIDQFTTVTPDGTEYVLVQKQADLTYGKTTLATVSAAAAPVQSVAGRTGAVTLTKADVALSNVDNTSDVNKPISTATQTALNAKLSSLTGDITTSGSVATLASTIGSSGTSGSSGTVIPVITYDAKGRITALSSTPVSATGLTITESQVTGLVADLAAKASTSYVDTSVANLVNSSPAALDTLGELATALGNDANFSTTVTNNIATKAPMLNPTAVKTSAYTAVANDFVPVDTTSNPVTITLPSAPANGTRFGVKLVVQGGTNTVTVTRGGTDVFNKVGGNTSVTITLLNQGVQFQYYNGIWYGVAADIGLTALDARYQAAGSYATDSSVLHLAGAETITGTKTVSSTGSLTMQDSVINIKKDANAGDSITLGFVNSGNTIEYGRLGTGASDMQLTAVGRNLRLGSTNANVLFTSSVAPQTNATMTLGTTALYWSNLYASRLNVNSTAYLDGGTAGQITASGVIASSNVGVTVKAFTTSTDGDMVVSGNGVNSRLFLAGGGWTTGATSQGTAYIRLDGTNNNGNFEFGFGQAGTLNLYSVTTGSGYTSRLNIAGSTGYVGLGTTAPTHTLTLPSTATGIALYNTSDQTTNYERGLLRWNSNLYEISTGKGGTGTFRALRFGGNDGSGQSFLTIQHNASTVYTFDTQSTTSTTTQAAFSPTFASTSTTQRVVSISPTISQTLTAGYTALLINPTETSTGSGSKLLADFQVGGASKASINNLGQVTAPRYYVNSTAYIDGATAGVIQSNASLYLDTSISTTSAPTTFGFNGMTAAGMSGRFQFGDNSNALQNGYGAAMQLYSYHRLELSGGRRAGGPSYITGAKKGLNLDDVSVMVDSTQDAQVVFGIQANSATQSSNLTTWYNSTGTALSGVNASGQHVMATSAGTPTGTPANGTMVFDTTASKLWVYNGAWKSVALA